MYFMCQLCESVVVPSCVGYEDSPTEYDFDYNDFGMDFNVTEEYDGDVLRVIVAEMIARLLKGACTYTIERDHAPYGYEVGVMSDVAGFGNFDVVAFDTARWPNSPTQVMGEYLRISISITMV